MTTKANKFRQGLTITLVVIVFLLAYLNWGIGPLVKGAVNNVVPHVLGVPTSVERVDVNVLGGRFDIHNVEIGNPEGFEESPYLFHMDSLHIDLSVRELFKGVCHIRELHVGGPHVWYHQKLTSNNLSAFLDKLEQPSNNSKEKASDKSKEKKPMPVIIDHFLLDEGTIGLKMGVGGEIPLMEIEMRDIGKDGAFMPVQVVKILAKSIGSSIISAVGSVGGLAVDGVKAVGGIAVEGVGAAVKGVGSLFGFGQSNTNAPSENTAK